MGSRSNPNGRTWQAVLSQWAVSHSKENNLSVVPTRDRELRPQHKKHVTRVTLMGKQGYRLGMCRMLLTTPTLAAWCCMSCAWFLHGVDLVGCFFTDLPSSERLLGKDVDTGSIGKSNGTRTSGSPLFAPDRASRVLGAPYPTVQEAHLHLLNWCEGKL